MRQAVLAFGSVLLLAACAHTRSPEHTASHSVSEQSGRATAPVAGTLLALTEEWVDTWNRKDVERMAEMHGDAAQTVYVIGETSSSVEWLLREIRETKFWDLSWKIAMVEPRVRLLGADAGLVSFRLVGEEASVRGTKPFSAAFTLVYQKLDGDWKIVHVQDSSRLEAPAP